MEIEDPTQRMTVEMAADTFLQLVNCKWPLWVLLA